MRERGFMSAVHLSCRGLINFLPELRELLEKDGRMQAIPRLLENGRKKLKFLVSRMLSPYLQVEWTTDDMEALGIKKQLALLRCTRAGTVKLMADCIAGDKAPKLSDRRVRPNPVRDLVSHTKRVPKQSHILHSAAHNLIFSAAVQEGPAEAYTRVQSVSALVSPRPAAYGETVLAGTTSSGTAAGRSLPRLGETL